MVTKDLVTAYEMPNMMLGRPSTVVNHIKGTDQEKKDRSSLLVDLYRQHGPTELARMIRDKEI